MDSFLSLYLIYMYIYIYNIYIYIYIYIYEYHTCICLKLPFIYNDVDVKKSRHHRSFDWVRPSLHAPCEILERVNESQGESLSFNIWIRTGSFVTCIYSWITLSTSWPRMVFMFFMYMTMKAIALSALF